MGLRLALGTMLEDLLFANETLEEGDGPSGGDANCQDRSDPERVSGQKRQRHMVPSRLVKLAAALKQLSPLLEVPSVSACPLNIRVVPSGDLAQARKRQATGTGGGHTFAPFESGNNL